MGRHNRSRKTALALFVLAGSTGCEGIAGVVERELACGPDPTPGDCRVPACDGTGSDIPDDTDFVDTPNDCLSVKCVGGVRVEVPFDEDHIEDGDGCTLDRCQGGQLVVEASAPPGARCDLWRGTSGDHSCARDTAGGLWCWGRNHRGQLGLGYLDEQPHPTPTRLEVVPPVKRVALGLDFGCALMMDGSVRCWGDNTLSKLGPPHQLAAAVVAPSIVELPGPAREIATGGAHTCVVLEDGTAHCWGWDSNGQLGDGTRTDRPYPGPVLLEDGTPLAGVARLALGYKHSCALLENGDVLCWGKGDALGTGSMNAEPPQYHPVRVMEAAIDLSAGTEHTCAVDRVRDVWCWGWAAYGMTGEPSPIGEFTALPRRVEGLAAAKEVVATFRHTCAVDAAGVWCWGGNFWGQLGDGAGCELDDGSTCHRKGGYAAVRVAELTGAQDIAAGYLHTCVTLPTGALWCWGKNETGALGDGTTEHSNVPVLVQWP